MYTLTVHLHCNEDPESIVRLKAKLVEAARVYRKDKETADWLVMQYVHDPRSFTIVERFENESVCQLCSYFLELGGLLSAASDLLATFSKASGLRRKSGMNEKWKK